MDGGNVRILLRARYYRHPSNTLHTGKAFFDIQCCNKGAKLSAFDRAGCRE